MRAQGRQAGGDGHRRQSPEKIPRALAKWNGVIDEVVLRAITGADTVEENVARLRAAEPSR
jgi:hypothetical protein